MRSLNAPSIAQSITSSIAPSTTPPRAPSIARRHAGFTLLELIVAASILALIAVFSWRGLDTLLREREAIATSQEAIDVMQRSFARIERDAMLARDAQIDDSGTLRLVAGNAAVEYRFVNGALTRIGDEAAAPMVLQGGIAKLVIEAWIAGAKGGWVRVKGLATAPLAPPPQQPRPAGVVAATPDIGANSAAPSPVANSVAAGAAATNGNPVPAAGPLTAQGQPLVAVATGIRMSIARADGTEVVRIFLIGSGG